jgi:bifunctional NMN adenylyltransferase/nudix hydrolase
MNGIFIGRFQPVHEGHISALGQAASRCAHLLILVGSANVCRSIKNPWTFAERKAMLAKKLHAAGIENYTIMPLNDYPYNDTQWISDVRETVGSRFIDPKPTLFGHFKDGNDYLRWFPDWKFQDLQATIHLNATQVRTKMFETYDKAMPQTAQQDWDYYEKEAILFANYPIPETLNFNCADAVIECQGFVVLIKRKQAPGANNWALPGGFKNANEAFLDAAIREAKEEVGIKVPEKVLRGSIVSTKLYDSPKRSFGIPRNTLAVHFRIKPDPDGSLPKLKAADDALEAEWMPIDRVVNRVPLYDDHRDILSDMTGVKPVVAYLNDWLN